MKRPILVNAAQMALDHPETFSVPAAAELERVNKGDLVKVCDDAERFWVLVTERRGDVLTGVVANALCGTRLGLGDTIEFHVVNIYQIKQFNGERW